MKGVIAAGDELTARAGAEMFRQGGNAVDAAVAATFVSFIAEVGFVQLGGSGLAHVYDPGTGRSVIYDFFSDMPGLGLQANSQKDFHRVTVDFGGTTQDFHIGRASVATPGNIFGLTQLANDLGKLPLTTILEPAIQMARDGIPLPDLQGYTCQLLSPIYNHTPSMRSVFARNGRLLKGGERLFLPDLAETLGEIARDGASSLRSGRLGTALIADQQAKGGVLTMADLARYEVRTHKPITIRYREFEVHLPGPPSTGGVLIAFALKLLSRFKFNFARGSAEHLQLLYEVMHATRLARQQWDREPDDKLEQFLAHDKIDRWETEVRRAIKEISRPVAPLDPRSPANTSHLSVIDEQGLAVSLTTTAGESAGYIVPGTGFIPNNMCGEADLHPEGFHTRPAGQRIPTMMTPTVITLNGQTRLVLGTGGSERIRSTILQVITNLLDFKMRLQPAVDVCRVHLENGILQCEHGYDEHAVSQLADWGYPVNRWTQRSLYFGGAHSASRTPRGRLVAAGDARRGGAYAIVD